MKDTLLKNSPDIQQDLKLFRVKHILLGDKSDGIPNVLYQTEFHQDFKNYLSELQLDIETPSELEEFIEKNGTEIIDNYVGEIFKTPRFGEKTAEKLINNPKEFINKKVKDKKKFYKNFKLNRQLIDLRKIPEDVKNEIINTFNNLKIETPDKKFIDKYQLHKCMHYKIGNKVFEDCFNQFENAFDDIKDLF
jgi:hydroxymethylpyrimidine pyrophosphatase-like HAD family hydrolase